MTMPAAGPYGMGSTPVPVIKYCQTADISGVTLSLQHGMFKIVKQLQARYQAAQRTCMWLLLGITSYVIAGV